jgi:hypothetical protein
VTKTIAGVDLPSVVLLAPGAWHRPEHLRLLVDELSDVDVHSVALACSGDGSLHFIAHESLRCRSKPVNN